MEVRLAHSVYTLPCADGGCAAILQGLQCLACLPESDAKESLKMMISYVLERLY